MKEKSCLIIKANNYYCNDNAIKELKVLISDLIFKKEINKFYIENNDFLSEIILNSNNLKVDFEKYFSVYNKKNINYKIENCKNLIKLCDYILFIGATTNDELIININLHVNYNNKKHIFFDSIDIFNHS